MTDIKGEIVCLPIKGVNLGEKNRQIYLTFRYMFKVIKTIKAKVSVYPTWNGSFGIDGKHNPNPSVDDKEHNLFLKLDTSKKNEYPSDVHIKAYADHEFKDIELGRIDIPVTAIVECCLSKGNLVKASQSESLQSDNQYNNWDSYRYSCWVPLI